MQVKRLTIEGLYGYINKDILFDTDLTLLVGINGSGKTSILNIINWIICPSIANLCITEFKKATLNFIYDKTTYTATCEHFAGLFTYSLKTPEKTYNPLTIAIQHDLKDTRQHDDTILNFYNGLKPDPNEKETWDLISKFPNPTIIGLDRNLYSEESPDHIYYEESLKSLNKIKSSPLERVKGLINSEYRKRKNAILILTNRLKNQLMLSTFDGSISSKTLNEGIRYKLNHQQIANAEQRVNEYFSKFEKQAITQKEQSTITEYFYQLKKITREHQEDPNNDIIKLLYSLNANQFIKVRNLLKEFEKFEKESQNEMNQIQLFLDTINFFLKDSAKKLVFEDETSEIRFHALGKNNEIVKEYKDIKYLSSGEQQLLILFSYISFNSQDGKIFIIDEPELSLHIKWQESFLEKLDLITPKNIQLILATHSPIIVHNKKEKAQLLLPYNE